jgi:hypothetical protein
METKQIPMCPKLWNHTRIFSYGGGTQSMAVLVAQARGLLAYPYDYFIFADVGHDSENQETQDYLRDIAIPFARQHDIPLLLIQKTRRSGETESLLEYALRTKRSIPIPMRMSNGAPGNRTCTQDFKIKVVDKWVRQRHYTHATVGLGFSLDERRRAHGKPTHFVDRYGKSKIGFWKRFEFPLIDLRLNRSQAIQLVLDAGLPEPPKSACWFCPFTSRSEWIERKRNDPDLVQKAALLEAVMNRKRGSIGRDKAYIHPQRAGRMFPLSEAIGDQMSLFEESCNDSCDSGYCFT